MIERIQDRYRDDFVASARRRIARARAGLESDGDVQAVFFELHALSGEAALLAFEEIAELASVGEAAARRWAVDADASQRKECSTMLDELCERIEQLAARAAGVS